MRRCGVGSPTNGQSIGEQGSIESSVYNPVQLERPRSRERTSATVCFADSRQGAPDVARRISNSRAALIGLRLRPVILSECNNTFKLPSQSIRNEASPDVNPGGAA
jgi:hypothetical protein